MRGPPAHPPELACPCCLPALGEFSEMTPHEGSPPSLTQPGHPARTGVPSPMNSTGVRRIATTARVSIEYVSERDDA